MPIATVNGTRINYLFDGSESAPMVLFSNSLASNLTIRSSSSSSR